MYHIRKKNHLMIAVLYLSCMLTVHGVSAQEQQTFSMKPVGPEAFRIILQSYEYDSGSPLDVEIVDTLGMENCTREKIVFGGVRDSRVPGYLAIPKSGEGPYPCIIVLHGFTGNKDEWWQDNSFYGGGLVSTAFLSNGYAVLALDAQYHGERSPRNENDKPGTLLNGGRHSRAVEMIVQSVTEYRRAIDYLDTRPEIDGTRIGVHGYSMGGMMTFLLTGAEPRIKVAVSCVTWNWDNPPEKYQLIAPYNFARAIGDRPFLMMMGRSDPLLPADAAERLYNLVKKSSTDLIFFESGHRLPDEYIGESLQWFQRHL